MKNELRDFLVGGAELPELGRVWFGDGRRAQVGILDAYLSG